MSATQRGKVRRGTGAGFGGDGGADSRPCLSRRGVTKACRGGSFSRSSAASCSYASLRILQVMYRLAELIEQNSDELAAIESLDNGKPL